MVVIRAAVVLIALLCIGSCVSAARPQTELPVYVTDSTALRLLPPSQCGIPLDTAQRISGRYSDKEFEFTVWTVSGPDMLSIVLMNDMGGGIGDLSYTESGVKYTSGFTGLPFKPEYVVMDFQLCFYDAAALSAALERVGLGWAFETFGENETRRVFSDGVCIIEIKKNGGALSYKNFLRAYSYDILGVHDG
jgi:hypothetical protein